MQIVIDIDDKVHGLLRYFEKSLGLNDKKDDSDDVKTALMRAVINGTPLPKEHGDLKDIDEIIEKIRRLPNGGRQWFVNAEAVFNIILDAPTIIEADKEE